jgi:hypothetical protein
MNGHYPFGRITPNARRASRARDLQCPNSVVCCSRTTAMTFFWLVILLTKRGPRQSSAYMQRRLGQQQAILTLGTCSLLPLSAQAR